MQSHNTNVSKKLVHVPAKNGHVGPTAHHMQFHDTDLAKEATTKYVPNYAPRYVAQAAVIEPKRVAENKHYSEPTSMEYMGYDYEKERHQFKTLGRSLIYNYFNGPKYKDGVFPVGSIVELNPGSGIFPYDKKYTMNDIKVMAPFGLESYACQRWNGYDKCIFQILAVPQGGRRRRTKRRRVKRSTRRR